MAAMQPIIVLTENDNEMWFPSWKDLANYYRELFPDMKSRPETFRRIRERHNYGLHNHYHIKHIWLSNFDREKVN